MHGHTYIKIQILCTSVYFFFPNEMYEFSKDNTDEILRMFLTCEFTWFL